MTKHKTRKALPRLSISSEVNRLRKKWNTHYNGMYLDTEKKTNEILADCKTAVDKIRSVKEELRGLDNALKALGYKPNSASTIYHKMLMLVMSDTYDDSRRKSISRWAKALLVADANGVTGAELVQWIEDNGGINEIAYPEKDKQKKVELREERIATAGTYFTELAKVEASLPASKGSPKQAGFVVMLGEVQPDFSVNVLRFYQGDSLINQLLEQEGKNKGISKSVKHIDTINAKAKAEHAKDDAIAKAIKAESAKAKKIATDKAAKIVTASSKETAKAKKQVNKGAK